MPPLTVPLYQGPPPISVTSILKGAPEGVETGNSQSPTLSHALSQPPFSQRELLTYSPPSRFRVIVQSSRESKDNICLARYPQQCMAGCLLMDPGHTSYVYSVISLARLAWRKWWPAAMAVSTAHQSPTHLELQVDHRPVHK